MRMVMSLMGGYVWALLSGSLGCGELMAADIGSREELAALQREDLAAAGRSLLLLACAGAPVPSLDLCAAGFSPTLTRTLGALLASPQGSPLGSWQQVRWGEECLTRVQGL